MRSRRTLVSLVVATLLTSRWGSASRARVLAYNEAGHFYTAVAVAHDAIHAFAGTDRREAALITYCAQVPDLTGDFDAITLWLKVNVYPAGFFRGGPLLWGAFSTCVNDDARHMATVHQFLHALTDSDANLVTQAALRSLATLRRTANGDVNKLCAAGFAVHLLGDSFAHQRLGQNVGSSRLYGPGIGHGFDGTRPDQLSYQDSSGSRVPLWLGYIDRLAPGLGDMLLASDRAKLKQLAESHPTDGSAEENQIANEAMILGLRQELAPDAAMPPWAQYSPTIEQMSSDRIQRATFEQAVKPAVSTLGPLALDRNSVWAAYIQAIVPAFAAQGIRTKCDPDRVAGQ